MSPTGTNAKGGSSKADASSARDDANEGTLRERLSRHGEDALARVVQDVINHPLVGEAVSAAMRTGEHAARAQEAALGRLQIPTVGDLEIIARRIRAVYNRLEDVEDSVERIEDALSMIARDAGSVASLEERLAAIELRLGDRDTPQKRSRSAAKRKPSARSQRPPKPDQ